MQPIYSQPLPPVQFVDSTEKLKRQRYIIITLAAVLALSLLVNCIVGFMVFTSGPATASGYKEFSSLNEVYQKAALGDKVKVTATVYDTTPANDGTVKVNNNTSNVLVVVPPSLKAEIKLFYGRNVLYGQITERRGPSLILTLEKIEP